MNITSSPTSMRDAASLSDVLETIAFPTSGDDLLLHAVACHATPSLIADIRTLATAWFADSDSVREALAAL